jgi:hypothetical protein
MIDEPSIGPDEGESSAESLRDPMVVVSETTVSIESGDCSGGNESVAKNGMVEV